MGCNCGDNKYNITVDNNGNCEPTTPVYNITLANVGVNGYSPIVRFVNETVDSFNIAVDNVTGTETSPAVPKLSYVSDQINNINTSLENKLNVDFSNSPSTISFPNNIQNIKANRLRLYTGDYYYSGMSLQLGQTSGELGYYSGKHLFLKQDKIHYSTSTTSDDNEIATIGDIPIKTSDLTNDSGFITSSDIPTVGNGTITLTQDGVNKGTFTTNQSGNTTIELDSGVTNPLTITDEVSNNFLEFIVNSSGSYIRTGTQGLAFNGYLINTVDNPLSLNDVAFGLKAIGLKYDNDTIKVNQDGQLYADVQGGGGSYTAGTGIDITNDTISVDNTVAMKTDIPTVNDSIITFTQGGITKGTITLNQSSNATIALDAGGTSSAVDSVNGQTGDVVLDASDVGALPDTTVIPTKTSDLTNDSNFATVSQIPTNNNQLTNGAGYITATALNGYATQTWVGQQGYLTSSDLTNYVTNSTLTTTLADYQPLLVSGTNIKTINNTSLLGSGNITVLVNTASNNTSLTIGGTASTTAYSTNVGFGSQATATAGQAFGHYAIASGSYSLALGQGAEASGNYAIQLGKGTNATAKTLSVGFGNNGNYQLLDGTTGLIPYQRIDSITNQNGSTQLKYWTGTQAEYDAITSKDNNTLYNITDDGITYDNIANNDLSNLSSTGKNVIDGQWVNGNNQQLVYNVTLESGTHTYDLSSYLPNDNHTYEVILSVRGRTPAASGSYSNIYVDSDLISGILISYESHRDTNYVQWGGTAYIPLNNRTINITTTCGSGNSVTGVVIEFIGYRRLGTNV